MGEDNGSGPASPTTLLKAKTLAQMIEWSCEELHVNPFTVAKGLKMTHGRMAGILKGTVLPTEMTLVAIAKNLFWDDEERNRALKLLHKELDAYVSKSFGHGYVEFH